MRRAFLQEYLHSYASHLSGKSSAKEPDPEAALEMLFSGVDRFRGIPGLYWGIWALIQATISQIDFDYASYAEVRLGEYWAWRAATEGREVTGVGTDVPSVAGTDGRVREERWGEE